MLTLDQLTEYIQAVREIWRVESGLRALGVDIGGYYDKWHDSQKPLLEAIFNEAQRQTIGWWLYDAPHGADGDPVEQSYMWEKDGTPIPLRNVAELHAYLLREEAIQP